MDCSGGIALVEKVLSPLEIFDVIEKIVKAPGYSVVGIAGQDYLVYLTNQEGQLSLWALNLNSGEKKKLYEGPITSVANTLSAYSKVVFSVDVTKGKELSKVYSVDIENMEIKEEQETEPKRIMGLAFDGKRIAFSGSLPEKVTLNLIDLEKEKEEVLHEDRRPFFVTGLDGQWIGGAGWLSGNPRSMELFFYDLGEGVFNEFTPKEGSVNESSSICGGKLIFSSNYTGVKKIFTLELTERSIAEPKTTYNDHVGKEYKDYAGFGWTEECRSWFIGKINGNTVTYVDGKELLLGQGFTSSLTVKDDKVYLTHSSLREPFSIYEYDLETNTKKKIVGSTVPEDVLGRISEPKFVKYKSTDGLEIPAFIIESSIAGKPGPTVVYVHGGPWSEVSNSWNRFIATLAATGFHVIAPNFRGSTGYGEEFRLMDIGDPGGKDMDDVVMARNYVIERGLADKIAIMGYSYGGFMTFLATAKKPDLWDAGVAGAGITDWLESYELSDMVFKRFIEVLFEGKREVMKDRSAVNFVENVKTPLCIIHPQNDTRTPLKPVLKYMQKLLELGKTFEAHIVPDIGHLITNLDDAVKILYPAVLFLNKYLKGKK